MRITDNEMNILRNADNEVLERMSKKYVATDKRSRDRMFEMSERKYEAMKANSIEFSENTVTGVERYKRPKWHRTAYAVCACFVAVIGIAGSALIIKNLSGTSDGEINKPPVISAPSEEGTGTGTGTGTSLNDGLSQTTIANAYVVSVDGTVVSQVTGETATTTVTAVPAVTNSNSENKTPEPSNTTVPNNAVADNTQNVPAQTTAPETSTASDSVKNYSIVGYWKDTQNSMIWEFDETGGSNLSYTEGMGAPFQYEITGYSGDSIEMMFHFFSVTDDTALKLKPITNDSFTITYNFSSESSTLSRITESEYTNLYNIGTYRGMSENFLESVTKAENWLLGNVSFYEHEYTYYNGEKYFRVAEENSGIDFNIDYINSYLHNSLTEALYNRRYTGVLEGDTPRFIEENGITYVLPRFTSGNFSWVDKDDIRVENATRESATLCVDYYNFGVIDTLRINVILSPDTNTYKIDSMYSTEGINY